MRAALAKLGVPEDVLQVVERPSIPLANELMAQCDLTIATGGPAMVKAAYGSGKPAYGVGAGNATMVIDETANIEEAARNTRISKTNDNGSGCSADGNLHRRLARSTTPSSRSCRRKAATSSTTTRRRQLQAAYWDAEGRRTADTIARGADVDRRRRPASTLPDGKTFFIVPERLIGKAHPFSTEKLGVVLAIFKYHGFEMALDMVRQIFETGGTRALVRHLFVRRRPHPPAGAGRAGQPDHGAPGAVELERRHLHQRHADDVEHGLRRLGRQHHQREHLAQALHERHVGEPADSGGPPVRAGAVRRVLQLGSLLTVRDTP